MWWRRVQCISLFCDTDPSHWVDRERRVWCRRVQCISLFCDTDPSHWVDRERRVWCRRVQCISLFCDTDPSHWVDRERRVWCRRIQCISLLCDTDPSHWVDRERSWTAGWPFVSMVTLEGHSDQDGIWRLQYVAEYCDTDTTCAICISMVALGSSCDMERVAKGRMKSGTLQFVEHVTCVHSLRS